MINNYPGKRSALIAASGSQGDEIFCSQFIFSIPAGWRRGRRAPGDSSEVMQNGMISPAKKGLWLHWDSSYWHKPLKQTGFTPVQLMSTLELCTAAATRV